MIIYVNVHPGAREERITKVSECEYRVWVKERAEKGKANLSLVKLLAKEFGVKQQQIIIKNPTSRKKLVEVRT